MVSERELRNLVSSARRGDPDAWSYLYRRSYRPLFAYARRRVRNLRQADEAVNETFVRAQGTIKSFKWRSTGFDAWLFGILRSVLFEFQTGSLELDDSGREAPGRSFFQEPVHSLSGKEDRIMRALAALTPSDQELIELRVLGGLAAEEIAVLLGKRADEIRAGQSKTLKLLTARLAEIENSGV